MSGTGWELIYRQPADVMERRSLTGLGWFYRNKTVIGSASQNSADWQWQVTSIFVADPAAP